MCLSGLEETPSGHHEDQVGAVQDNDDNHPFSQLALQVPELCYREADVQHRLAARTNDGRVVRLES